jgi:hypothetical protein
MMTQHWDSGHGKHGHGDAKPLEASGRARIDPKLRSNCSTKVLNVATYSSGVPSRSLALDKPKEGIPVATFQTSRGLNL